MNILWIMNVCPFPENSGGKVVIANRIKEVSKKHSIFLVTECDELTKEIREEINKYCECSYIEGRLRRSLVRQIFDFIFLSNNLGKHRNRNITKTIKKVLSEVNIDIVLIELPMAYISFRPLEKYANGIPIIINQHNIEFDSVRTKTQISEIRRIIKLYAIVESNKLFRFEKKMCQNRNIRAMSFVSREDMDIYRSNIFCKGISLFVSPIGTRILDRSIMTGTLNDKRKKIVFVSSFDYAPNIHGAIWFCKEVMPMIRQKYEQVALYLVGKDPKIEVVNLATDDIIVTGSVPDIRPYYSDADIIIVPIFYGGGVKTKLIEAGMFEKPVVSTSVGCRGTEFKNQYDLIIADSPKEFGNACISILNDPDVYSKFGRNMKNTTVNNYLWNKIGEEYNEKISEVCRK